MTRRPEPMKALLEAGWGPEAEEYNVDATHYQRLKIHVGSDTWDVLEVSWREGVLEIMAHSGGLVVVPLVSNRIQIRRAVDLTEEI